MSDADGVRKALMSLASPTKAAASMRFFKAGPGQYGEGDHFIGVTVPEQRKVARSHRDLDLSSLADLLNSKEHEFRLTALLILVGQFERADESGRAKIFDFYMTHHHRVNNWDLVDSSAAQILGETLHGGDWDLLVKLAGSSDLWERRIAMIACFAWIRRGEAEPAFNIAKLLLNDRHDLIHKAVGWMLREVGKRCGRKVLEDFLLSHYKTMPRTMLRYAIEHFEPARRKDYLAGRV